MFAIIENKGKQFKVSKDLQIKIDKIEAKEGDKITFDKVLLVSDGKSPKIGAPVVEGASVTGKIVKHARDKKIIVFKKIRRHNYRRKIGHRQDFTLVKIEDIKS
ncbi:MAG: 50S ribosomal protein L21 [Rickettsiales bacterium]|nr:50S ribosomal protein L21 [Rickettsiales bacterium]